jgi:hypothetical protein
MGVISVSFALVHLEWLLSFSCFFYFAHINIFYLYHTESALISPESRDARRSKNSKKNSLDDGLRFQTLHYECEECGA